MLNGYQTARSKKELSKFSVSNCQERGKEEVREEVREREKRGGRREREKRGGRREEGEGEERREEGGQEMAIPVLRLLYLHTT